ncbi:hypothetical protein BYT27DRAFT_7074170 [Phlegmacium glaucopus]|nr:hypothetical protein BYT27DRAFT_7074170 [Phlegmacium glaucopus]
MSEYRHKRKRSLKDSTVDISRMRMALNHLEALKEELDGIEETEEELQNISDDVLALDSEDALRGAKKPRLDFSTVVSEDLKKAGVIRKCLVFLPEKISELMSVMTTKARAENLDLHSRLRKIYARVNMDYSPSSRMILDAILLALAEIVSAEKRGVAILPGMRIAQEDGVQISHPVTGYELWLSGNVDYAVIEYDDEADYKDRLLAPGGSREDALDIAKGLMFLVEAKRQSPGQHLVTHTPEAVSQAIALLKSANLPEVRFCLSDGQAWIFFILKSENGTMTYYESAVRSLSRDTLKNTDLPLCEIVQLVCEWLRPTMTDLFELL